MLILAAQFVTNHQARIRTRIFKRITDNKANRVDSEPTTANFYLPGNMFISRDWASWMSTSIIIIIIIIITQCVRKVAVHLGMWVAISRRRIVGPWTSLTNLL
jgi:hypothetical protein